MRVWTIQRPDVLRALRDKASWRATDSQLDADLRRPYAWMAAQMRKRIATPASFRSVPIWCWVQWRGQSEPRPDLRHRGHLPRGVRGVRLELEIDADRLLCSDFDLWHFVLNDLPLPRPGDTRTPRTEPVPNRRAREASWLRIFDLAPTSSIRIQGVFAELRRTDVIATQSFIAR